MAAGVKTEQILKAQNGDNDALEQLITENSGLIWSIARRFFGRGVDADDLYQLGCMGFIKAVRGFDTSFETQFSTYAVPKITGEIRRFLRDDGAIKVSRSIKEQAYTIKTARQNMEQRLGRKVHISELSEETGIDATEIAMCETATAAVDSLQRPATDDGLTLEQMLSDTENEEKLIEHVSLREAVSSLEEREKMVITLRYFRGMTQTAAARVIGVSQVQISRIEKKAVAELKRLLE